MAIEQVPEGEELAHDRMVNLGAQWHRVGLERPHFCTRFRGQSDAWGRSSPQRDSFRCLARMRRQISDEISEDGKSYSLHFQNCHFFTRRSALLNSFSKTCNKRTRETHRAEKVKSGGSDPTFLQRTRPKVSRSRSRPRWTSGRHVLRGECADQRNCQTRCLTFCMNTKGEARCPF